MFQPTLSFSTSAVDGALIADIADRAVGLLGKHADRLSTQMDITAVHANGNPLRLSDLLAADDFNFLHDVGGIARYLDRHTGKLGGCFRPRFSQPVMAAA